MSENLLYVLLPLPLQVTLEALVKIFVVVLHSNITNLYKPLCSFALITQNTSSHKDTLQYSMSPFLELSIKNIVVNKYLVEQAKFLYLRLKEAQSEVGLYSFRLS